MVAEYHFDYWSIYLVESSSEARIIYSSFEKNLFEINLKAGLFDGIIPDVYDALNVSLKGKITR